MESSFIDINEQLTHNRIWFSHFCHILTHLLHKSTESHTNGYQALDLKQVFFLFFLFQQFIRVKGNIKKAYEKVPGLESVLPREYGGHNRSIKDILSELVNRKNE